MELTELNNIFDLKYGNKFDANKMEFVKDGNINFISRNSNNNGCVGTVKKVNGVEPYMDGLLTVSLGGSFLLSSFLQPKNFYTAQNVAVLIPKKEMSMPEKIYYCKLISMNRFKYSAFGREANKTLKYLKIPKNAPKWIHETDVNIYQNIKASLNDNTLDYTKVEWSYFKLGNIFKITLGKNIDKNKIELFSNKFKDGYVPYVTRTIKNNSVLYFVRHKDFSNKIQKGNCIIIGAEGIRAFYQSNDFITGTKINILHNYNLNIYSALYINTIINHEIKHRFNYGRILDKSRLGLLSIKLPIDEMGKPNWDFMENYIKSLPFSSSL